MKLFIDLKILNSLALNKTPYEQVQGRKREYWWGMPITTIVHYGSVNKETKLL